MKPVSISEQLMFSTVRLQTSTGSTGTGFFFTFDFGPSKSVPVIVTNKHVVNENENEIVRFFLHKKQGHDPGGNIDIEFKTKWIFHPSQDLCFCYVAPLLHDIRSRNNEIFFVPLTEELIKDENGLAELNAIEDVIMVGYPNGLWDQKNNFPLFRKGITASHPAIDFNSRNVGAIDMASFPGSSGSPIFVLDERGFADRNGTFHVGGRRVIFLGILFQGPQMNTRGEIVVEHIPTKQKFAALTPMMINIGYYVKSAELLEFKHIIKKKLPNE